MPRMLNMGGGGGREGGENHLFLEEFRVGICFMSGYIFSLTFEMF